MKRGKVGSIFLAILAVIMAVILLFAIRQESEVPASETGWALESEPGESQEPESSSETQSEAPSMSSEAPTESTPAPEPPDPNEVAALALMENMTLDEKICQMFFVSPTTLTGYAGATVAGTATQEALAACPVGGIIYFGENVLSAEQVKSMVEGTQRYSAIPLLIGVDEEGGRVSRLSGVGLTTALSPMATYGAAGDAQAVRELGARLGQELRAAGFNVDFAPVADVVTNANNTEIGDRSFSTDAGVASDLVAAMTGGLQDSGVIACIKHFPGHGSTEADSHLGLSRSERTLEELRQTELLPFRAGLEAGAGMVMVSHMSLPNVVGDNTPCDLSYAVVTGLLREELDYNGVIITDSHQMGAITEAYGCAEATLLAIQAGCDMILLPTDLDEAVQAVRSAVEEGTLTQTRIDESVLRILTLKYAAGIISAP